jgi:hypothetical protein
MRRSTTLEPNKSLSRITVDPITTATVSGMSGESKAIVATFSSSQHLPFSCHQWHRVPR